MRKHYKLFFVILLLIGCAEDDTSNAPCADHATYTGKYNDLFLNFTDQCTGTIRKVEEACNIPFKFSFKDGSLRLSFTNYNGEMDRSPNCLDEIRTECQAQTQNQYTEIFICRRI